MWHPRHLRQILIGCAALGAAALFGGTANPAAAQPLDPVEALRQALPLQLGEDRIPAARELRKKTLRSRAAALKTVGELRRALALTEWKDAPGSPELIRPIDAEVRRKIGERLKDALEAIAGKGDTVSRLAVARMLAEMGTSIRALDATDLSGFGRSLTPILVKLTTDPDLAVRAAAARALGKINPFPEVAVAALKKLLETDVTAGRRAAAEGLLSMVQVVAQIQKKGRAQTGVEATPKDVIDTSTAVANAIGAGVRDADALVRRNSLEALLAGASAFGDLVPDPDSLPRFPTDRKLTEAEEASLRQARQALQKEQELFAPLARAMQKQGGALAVALTDPDATVRLDSRRTLETLAATRFRLLRRQAAVPDLPGEGGVGFQGAVRPAAQKAGGGAKGDPLGLALRPSIEVIARGVRDRDVRVRRASIDFLESLEDAAAPAVPALVGALGDHDRFVRWAAARALGRIGPVRTDLTVPALARVLSDPDLDASKEAAATLTRYGPDAKGAVPALAVAAGVGDAEMRVAAIKALGAMGAPAAAPAVPALAAALGSEDAGVRVAAAETLGKLGAAARSAVPALRRALDDENADVRRAASDAVLGILAAGLSGPSAALRREAAETLGQMGVAAAGAEEALRHAADDEDAAVRRAVNAALDSIRPPR